MADTKPINHMELGVLVEDVDSPRGPESPGRRFSSASDGIDLPDTDATAVEHDQNGETVKKEEKKKKPKKEKADPMWSDWSDLPPIPTARDISDLLIPPLNFSPVKRGVYRSGFPDKKNFRFLLKLKLHTILNLSSVQYSPEALTFFAANNIRSVHMEIGDNHEPFQELPKENMRDVLAVVHAATPEHPILVHCAKGTHRTGCVIGCLRKRDNWILTAIFSEYQQFAGTRVRLLDQQFIELWTRADDPSETNKPSPPRIVGAMS